MHRDFFGYLHKQKILSFVLSLNLVKKMKMVLANLSLSNAIRTRMDVGQTILKLREHVVGKLLIVRAMIKNSPLVKTKNQLLPI